MRIQEQIIQYIPYNEQEERDLELIKRSLEMPDVFTRENTICHMTASAWVVNPTHDKVLMAFHNIYHSWSWLGGHADGEEDLQLVALKEVQEESGVKNPRILLDDIFSIEVLTVDGHIKNGKFVSSHLHLNVTYLIEADDNDDLLVKEDENSDVAWFGLDAAIEASTEPWFKEYVYPKLNEKLSKLSL